MASNMFLREEAFTLVVECGFSVSFSTRPACQDEGDLVHEVGNVVGNIQGLGCTIGIVNLTEEITCWVDCPTDTHNDAHVVIRLLDGCGHVAGSSCRRGLTSKDLEEDEAPAGQSQGEACPCVYGSALASVTECKHQDSVDQEFPEACWMMGALAAFRMRLNSIICNGTVMLQSMYLYTIG